jgi:hypothetical protein
LAAVEGGILAARKNRDRSFTTQLFRIAGDACASSAGLEARLYGRQGCPPLRIGPANPARAIGDERNFLKVNRAGSLDRF